MHRVPRRLDQVGLGAGGAGCLWNWGLEAGGWGLGASGAVAWSPVELGRGGGWGLGAGGAGGIWDWNSGQVGLGAALKVKGRSAHSLVAVVPRAPSAGSKFLCPGNCKGLARF